MRLGDRDVVLRESFRGDRRKDQRRPGVSGASNQFRASGTRVAENAMNGRKRIMRAARNTGFLLASAALSVAVSACGSSGSTGSANTASTPTGAPASTQASNVKPAAAVVPAAHLAILSPRAGGHTGSTLTVRVAASGAPSGAAPRLRYVLDGRFSRSGSTHVTFHELAPGLHRLQVMMLGSTDTASTTFTVNAPAPAPAPAPVATMPAATEAPHTTTAPTPAPQAPATQAPPKPAPVEKAPAPPAKTAPSGASEGIPQGPNAGDGDGDNHGEPSDGDGDI